ncbi:MAG: glycosyltransferase family 39 protein [Proteobacteria bacterium]|nr:glycosyltransferase family 39 protein [Pseudomonadota bacterium]
MKLVFKLWWMALAIKAVLAAIIPFSLDESYYWVWGQRLQLSYFDHPGMVGWLFGFGEWLLPFGYASRLPLVIVGHLGLLFWILILEKHLNQNQLLSFVLIYLLSPMLGFGGLIATPDVLVVTFWAFALWSLCRYLEAPSSKFAIALGAALGLGFCAKYHIVIFVFITFCYLTIEKLWHRLNMRHLAAVIVTGAIFSLPVFVWNLQNDFASFKFQLDHGLGESQWSPWWTFSYLTGQLIVIFPVFVLMALRSSRQPSLRIFTYFGWGPILFFFLTSFRGLVEINWPIVGYASIFALSSAAIFSRRAYLFSLAIWATLTIVVVSHSIKPFLPGKKLNEPFYYQLVIDAAPQYENLFANTYQMASALWHAHKKPYYKINGIGRFDFYDSMPESLPTKSPFFIALETEQAPPQWITPENFEITTVEQLGPLFKIVKVTNK